MSYHKPSEAQVLDRRNAVSYVHMCIYTWCLVCEHDRLQPTGALAFVTPRERVHTQKGACCSTSPESIGMHSRRKSKKGMIQQHGEREPPLPYGHRTLFHDHSVRNRTRRKKGDSNSNNNKQEHRTRNKKETDTQNARL